MKKQLTTLAMAFVALTAMAITTNAQQFESNQRLFVQPPVTNPAPQANKYYFGMELELLRDGYGQTSLRVVRVTPGSPACRAGLEFGDQILSVNGRGFGQARDSFEAVRLMNAFTDVNQTAPAAAASAYYVAPPQAMASMVVRNVRNGQNVNVRVQPELRFTGQPAPAAAASARSRR